MKHVHIVLVAAFVGLFSLSAHAQQVDELRVGGTWAQPDWLDKGHAESDQLGINAEILFSPVFLGSRDSSGNEHNQFVTGLLTPRPHVGLMANFASNGTSYGYAGLTWHWDLGDVFFTEIGFGLGINNGKKTATLTRAGLGSNILFHEIFALGMHLNESWTAIFQLEHLSHAQLFHESNRGLSNASLKVGYKF